MALLIMIIVYVLLALTRSVGIAVIGGLILG